MDENSQGVLCKMPIADELLVMDQGIVHVDYIAYCGSKLGICPFSARLEKLLYEHEL